MKCKLCGIERNNKEYLFQEIIEDKFVVDFKINNNIIEINGYWHKNKEKDNQRKMELENL